ncbi:PIR Superfamily Protein [Plasmodium ovale wallikeri]|uniref:Plasmodium vivax Vir protein, putative n=2 Tax=Plasmodium ovale TaxID=36330 RepID=A0A1C3KGN4_PLAOA|nr:PIR Superfamily Protein [Plasmodium ovale wallikeri]SBT72872.1 Plasmodium vivax Vir protein, putative [Plasmodium ovale]
MKEWESILKNLTAYSIYKKLNDGNDVEEGCKYCNTAESDESTYKGIYKLCCHLEYNLKNLTTILSDIDDAFQRCNYLNLWFYHQIWKTFINFRKEIYTKTSIISKLIYVWDDVYDDSSLVKCENVYHDNISLDILNDLKSLHDYFKNYDSIIPSISSDNERCKMYYDYVKENEDLYQRYKDKLCDSKNKKWGDYCNSHTQYDPTELLSKIKCNEKISRSMEKSESVSAHVEPEVGASPTISSNIVSSVTAVSTMSTVFLILYFLYKFTPFGSSLNRLIPKGIITKETIDEEAGYTFMHNSENKDLNFDDNKYNIAYNSL